MKKIVFVVLIAVATFGLMSCANESTPEILLEGKWADIMYNSNLEFQGETFKFDWQGAGSSRAYSGTFSQTNNTITFNVTSGWIWDQKYNPWTATYKFEDNNKYSSVLVIANLIGQSYVIHGKYRKL
jgi:hypothetical protein